MPLNFDNTHSHTRPVIHALPYSPIWPIQSPIPYPTHPSSLYKHPYPTVLCVPSSHPYLPCSLIWPIQKPISYLTGPSNPCNHPYLTIPPYDLFSHQYLTLVTHLTNLDTHTLPYSPIWLTQPSIPYPTHSSGPSRHPYLTLLNGFDPISLSSHSYHTLLTNLAQLETHTLPYKLLWLIQAPLPYPTDPSDPSSHPYFTLLIPVAHPVTHTLPCSPI